ncbi:macrophage colony-stimulating factor 1 receptor [Phycodurus eques]|uniref:macrophage colony-stimulating factor 1 receptor n=1 Tax=Phycodurus eques TaxID=693459 RepID=UPI002ACDB4C8|nr:macrophage colony-stimulating factor 1 receptor [Phycodurus eques]XP_061541251.1 macrophage colony-stimulating factor 1 receptor [Phycodurus eques]XP_061541252.1 macrophage colony-stimulating factor 1 receptor [Phycodurus eques]
MQSLLTLLLAFVVSVASVEWRRPVIRLNSKVVLSPEVVVNSGTPLDLRCEGDRPVNWQPRLAKHKRYMSRGRGNVSILKVAHPSAQFTGTYKCFYIGGTQHHNLTSSVHVFVKDPSRVFWTSSTLLRVVKKEGEVYLLPCLLTDPGATDISLRMENGTTVPPGMNFTVYRHRGILIHSLHPSFNADYVCTAKVNGVERTSKAFSINVIQKLRFPPYVFLETDEYIRIAGEELKISCTTHNPNFNYNVTWIYTTKSKPTIEERVRSSGENRLDIQSILTIPFVDLADTGNISCIGTNEAGVNSSTTYLLVVDKPYIRLLPQLSPKLTHKGLAIEVNEGEDLELTVLIEAYPHIVEHSWQTPTSPSTSAQENKFIRYNNRYHATLQLKRMNAQEQGQYTFNARSDLANASVTFQVQMYQRPVAMVRWENVTTLTCTSFGYPAPRIIWYQCFGIRPTCNESNTGLQMATPLQAQTVEVQREEYGAVAVESVLTVGPSSRRMTVECVAFNLVGVSSDTFAMEVSDKLFTSTLTGSAGILSIFLVLMVFVFYKYKQKPRYEIRWKIIEARDGNNYTFVDPTQLPYNEKWEFPRDKLKLGKILGAGAFGKVVEATAIGLGERDNVMRVAVKMLKASAHSDEREALMSELKILSHLGHHQNIVNLLGACTYGGPVLVITEYCGLGDLLNFLRQKAETFMSFVMNMPAIMDSSNDYKNICNQKLFIRSDSGISSESSSSYLEMRPCQLSNSKPLQNAVCEETGEWPLGLDDMLRFSYQVAQGLEFLAAKNCIHRDVAARNILLTDHRVAKICDFGLARDIMSDTNYVVKGNARLPVKWMAPESIFDCVYTVQSDVWSYGILLWEIFSLGKSPYPSMAVDSSFYKMVKRGYQMCQPDFAPPEIYDIMKMCWNLEPTERPTFSKISQMIQKQLGEQAQQEQLIYQNVQQQVTEAEEPEECDQPKCCDTPCEQSCDPEEEEEQPLMKTNSYQFC